MCYNDMAKERMSDEFTARKLQLKVANNQTCPLLFLETVEF